MGLYCNRSEAARFFGISRTKLYTLLGGLEKEIKAGRYGDYSMPENLVNKAVLVDYMRYRKALNDRKTRPFVPPYNPLEAMKAVIEWTAEE